MHAIVIVIAFFSVQTFLLSLFGTQAIHLSLSLSLTLTNTLPPVLRPPFLPCLLALLASLALLGR